MLVVTVEATDLISGVLKFGRSTLKFLYVRGSVHHSTVHKEKPTRCSNVSKFYYCIFIWCATCFGRHAYHCQEPKTALAASGFSYVGGRCQAQCAWQRLPSTRPTTFRVRKTRGCQCSFRLLTMVGVSPKTCCASYKYGIIKFWYIGASCWFFFMNYTEVLMELLPIHSEYMLNFYEIVQLFIPETSIVYILNAIQDFSC